MKLLSFIHRGRETWGAVVGDSVIDMQRVFPQYPTLLDYIASESYLQAAEHVKGLSVDAKLADITFLPVIPRPEKIVCAVRNYMDHHNEVIAGGVQRGQQASAGDVKGAKGLVNDDVGEQVVEHQVQAL